jgi:hypothetical protein
VSRLSNSGWPILVAIATVSLAPGACSRPNRAAIGAVEEAYQRTRAAKDQLDVTRSRNASASLDGVPLAALVDRYREARAALLERLPGGGPDLPGAAGGAGGTGGPAAARGDGTPGEKPPDEDDRAIATIRRALDKDLPEETAPAAAEEADQAAKPGKEGKPDKVDCAYDPAKIGEGADGFKHLSTRIYACFGQAAHHLPFEGKTLDRLTIMGMLPVTDDAAARRRLFMALAPVWQSLNGDGGETSPYRLLVRLNAASLKSRGTAIESGVADLGIDPHLVEEWLVSVLEAWRASAPDTMLEPWDFAYAAGKASRTLSKAIPLAALRTLNDRYYHDLGAEIAKLGVQYDLEPRDGKDPVAFTTFGRRPARHDGAWAAGEPWVFASYSIGGLDNLGELLHETGHAIHIAAIRTRPAFMDWPDSDTFTEAIADIAALEIYEPAWQSHYLGVAAPLSDTLRTKYAGIVMDVAWSLFEIRLHHNPKLDPNRVWTELTERYLRIKPHPELSWWALRGQLINAPGYMMNYAVGAILIADVRVRTKQEHGAYAEGDPAWYAWVSERLYRFGLERTSKQVVEEFLGRPVSPRALLVDLSRATDRAGG